MWRKYINAITIAEVVTSLAKYGEQACIVARGTDLILEIERGIRKDVDVLIDISRILEADLMEWLEERRRAGKQLFFRFPE